MPNQSEKEFFDEVAQHIESGQYFEEAKSWYHLKYNYPMIERAFCIWFFILALFIAYFTISIINSFLPLEQQVPIAVRMYDQVNSYSQLRKLSPRKDFDPNLALQQYLMLQFIKAYESYASKGDEHNICKINDVTKQYLNEEICRSINMLSTIASKKVLNNFFRLVDVSRYDSYIIRYREGERIIKLLPATIKIKTKPRKPSDKYTTHNATTEFELSEYFDNFSDKVTKSKWRANIEYIYDNLEYDTELGDFKPTNFKVINYSVTEVK